MLSDSEETAPQSDDLKDIFDHLEKQLTKQLEKCKTWRYVQLHQQIHIE